MHQIFLRGNVIYFTIGITLVEFNHQYAGYIMFPDLQINLNFRLNFIIPLTELAKKDKPINPELLPYVVQIKIFFKNKEKKITREEYDFFYNTIVTRTHDAHQKIEDKKRKDDATTLDKHLPPTGKSFPVWDGASEYYCLFTKPENIPETLREKVIVI